MQTIGRLLFIYGLGSRVHTLETDLMEGFVVTKKPTTPKDTKGQGDTNTQHNRQTTSLRSSSLWRSHTSGCRLQTWNAVAMQFCVGYGIARLYFSQIPPNFGTVVTPEFPFF